jgi:type II secretory ATPase GspE/PulE/Tfp pilus assembly ATPase PilB-like protein
LAIGEIRTGEAALTAIDAARSGHTTWSTTHTDTALGTIPRIATMLRNKGVLQPLEEFCDRSVLSGLLHQRLVPVLCDKCKLPYLKVLNDTEGKIYNAEQKNKVLPRRTIKQLEDVLAEEDFAGIYVLGKGCADCGGTGVNKQTVVAEVVEINDDMLRHFRKGDMVSAEEYWLSRLEGRTFLEHALDRIKAGEIDPTLTAQRLNLPLNNIPAERKRGRK